MRSTFCRQDSTYNAKRYSLVRAPINLRLGRFWYSSCRLSICACSLSISKLAAIKSARSNVLDLAFCSPCSGSADAAFCVGFDSIFLLPLICVSSSCACFSKSSTRFCSRASCAFNFADFAALRASEFGCNFTTVVLSFGAGKAVFSLRFSSVLPPRSKLACANNSALSGAVLVFAFTNTTSSEGNLSANLRNSGAKLMLNSTP